MDADKLNEINALKAKVCDWLLVIIKEDLEKKKKNKWQPYCPNPRDNEISSIILKIYDLGGSFDFKVKE